MVVIDFIFVLGIVFVLQLELLLNIRVRFSAISRC